MHDALRVALIISILLQRVDEETEYQCSMRQNLFKPCCESSLKFRSKSEHAKRLHVNESQTSACRLISLVTMLSL